jgi:hypothetical protein
MPPTAISASPPTLERIEVLFDVEDAPAVRSYLGKHPYLVPLLIDVHQVVPRYFPNRTRICLQLLTDRDDGDHVDFFAIIETDLSEDKALQALDKFDDEWWLATAVQGSGLLTIDVETADDD